MECAASTDILTLTKAPSPVSRLDSFIRRLEAQRSCLNRAVDLVRDVAGPVFELGLGNGRTYHHLREALPDRDVFVFDRQVSAHPDCIPDPQHLILGDVRETLIAVRPQFACCVALAHMDIGTGDKAESSALAATVSSLLVPLMRAGGVVVSEPKLVVSGWSELPLPEEVPAGRYWMYSVGTWCGG